MTLDSPTASPLDILTLLSRSPESDAPLENTIDLCASLNDLPPSNESRILLLQGILALIQAERAFLLEPDSTEDSGWQALLARSFEAEDVLHPLEKIVAPLLHPCQEQGKGYFTENLEEERIHEQLTRSRQPRTRSVLILPLGDSNRFLYADHRFQPLTMKSGGAAEMTCLVLALAQIEERLLATAESQQAEEELRKARRQLRERRPVRAEANARPDATDQPTDPRGFRGDFSEVVGRSPELIEILEVIEKVAPTTAPVLVNGESGTGKELIARAIHTNSARATGPFVSENCAALTESLLESELFGYVRGAFTGAMDDRPGLFELASGGTLFLDEVGDMSTGMQKKLLRALQESVVRRVGGAESVTIDVRVIAATNKDLKQEVAAGRFREDLFYRLNVINILLPPLRERRQDVPLLMEHILGRLREETGQVKKPSVEFEQALTTYHWPGNIRELQNEIRRAFALSDDTLDVSHLSPSVGAIGKGNSPSGPSLLQLEGVLELGSLKEATEALEQRILDASLRHFRGNKARICEQLKIPKTTLYAKLKRYGLSDGPS